MHTPEQILQSYFSYKSFRGPQKQLIDGFLQGHDVMGIMPTGAGKSICYQIPALMTPGITLVISPLIALMKDQVESLIKIGIPAAYLSHNMPANEQKAVFARAYNGKIKLLYISPERLAAPSIISLFKKMPIAYVAVDEAHCISQWGQNFRPSYLQISEFLHSFYERPPVGAFTATATKQVRDDIIKLLELKNPIISISGFDRENLNFINEQPRDKLVHLVTLLYERHNKSGIVYCSTRRAVDEVYSVLTARGFAVSCYHAGMTSDERQKNQDKFLNDEAQIMVATNAFGMGINKKNVRYVIHYNIPQSMESYYQEAGRAGRDGKDADCILLYSPQDAKICEFLINQSYIDCEDIDPITAQKLKERDRKRLQAMISYAATNKCLRAFILDYFGEKADKTCMSCSSCQKNYHIVEATIDAQKILSCVFRLAQRGRTVGKNTIAEILHAEKSERIIASGFESLSTYGIMRNTPIEVILLILNALIKQEYLSVVNKPYPVIELCTKSAYILKGEHRFFMPVPRDNNSNYAMRYTALYEKLRAFRAVVCAKENCSPDAVMTCDMMEKICQYPPSDMLQLRELTGLTPYHLEMFGEELLKFIKPYIPKETAESEVVQSAKQIYKQDPRLSLPWTADEDKKLIRLASEKTPLTDIVNEIDRPFGMVLARMKALNLEIIR